MGVPRVVRPFLYMAREFIRGCHFTRSEVFVNILLLARVVLIWLKSLECCLVYEACLRLLSSIEQVTHKSAHTFTIHSYRKILLYVLHFTIQSYHEDSTECSTFFNSCHSVFTSICDPLAQSDEDNVRCTQVENHCNR